jgi:ATP-dependent DNA helicase RecG
LGDGTTFLRNPNIARIARQRGIIEKMGTGIRLIFESCKKLGIRRPEYHEEGDFVKIVFFFESVKEPGKSDEESILSLVKTHKKVAVGDVAKFLSVSRNTATRKLQILIDLGKIVRQGKGPSVRYILKQDDW